MKTKKMISVANRILPGIYWSVALLILASLFYFDSFGILDRTYLVDDDNNGKIYSRVALSREYGIFHDCALLGFCDVDNPYRGRMNRTQFNTLSFDCSVYKIYASQIGGQGMVYSIIYHFFDDARLFNVFASASSAMVLILLLAWVNRNFGPTPSILSFVMMSSLRYMVYMGDNLALIFPFTLLIFVGLLWALESRYPHIWRVSFALFFLKYLLNGAEFVGLSIVLAYLPLIFYGLKDDWGIDKAIKGFKSVSFGLLLASALSVMILMVQISIVMSPHEAISQFQEKIWHRTLCITPTQGYQLDCRPFTPDNVRLILDGYLQMEVIWLGGFILRAGDMVTLLFLMSMIGLISEKSGKIDAGYKALMYMSWFSLLSPIGYILVNFGHSTNYGHMGWTPLCWDIPFDLLVIIFSALTISKILLIFTKRYGGKR